MYIKKLTPLVKQWIGLAFEDTPDFWEYLNKNPGALKEAIAYAQKFFTESYPNLPFDNLAKENRTRINFEFYIVRNRFQMEQRSYYTTEYFNELAKRYGFSE